jgi:hypothetical protein
MRQAEIERILLNEREAAAALGVSVKLLRRWRMLNKGPRFVKLSGRIGSTGGRIAYPARDLYCSLESLPSGGSKAAGGAA